MRKRKLTPTAVRRAWLDARQRCNDIGNRHYGGRGIRMHDAWQDDAAGFDLFLQHIGPKPAKQYSLDRINNDGNYEPGNVRWATHSQQNRNQRRHKGKQPIVRHANPNRKRQGTVVELNGRYVCQWRALLELKRKLAEECNKGKSPARLIDQKATRLS